MLTYEFNDCKINNEEHSTTVINVTLIETISIDENILTIIMSTSHQIQIECQTTQECEKYYRTLISLMNCNH